jgi:Protein of unknown function (DUF1769)
LYKSCILPAALQKDAGITVFLHAVTFLVQSFTRVVSSASIIENSESPQVIYPLILAAQSVHVSTPGFEPEVSADVDLEDVSLMAPGAFSEGQTPSVAERKAFFSKMTNRKVCAKLAPIRILRCAVALMLVMAPSVDSSAATIAIYKLALTEHLQLLQGICFEPGLIYTFHVRQHIVDVANYKIPIPGFGKFSLLPYLQGQPIRFMAYDRSSKLHLWNLEVRTCAVCVRSPLQTCRLSSGQKPR